MNMFNMLPISSTMNLPRETIVLNYLLILCFVIISTSLCLEFQPSLLISLESSSHTDNASYNLNISFPIPDIVDFVVKKSSLGVVNISQISEEYQRISNDNVSTSVPEYSPSLKIDVSKTIVNAGDSFSINCSTVYKQKLILAWYKDSKPLISHLPNIKVIKWMDEKDDKIFQWIHFTIKLASLKESGIYSCQALNNLSEVSINISVVTKEGIYCESSENCNQNDFACVNNRCQCRNGTISKFGLCLTGKSIDESCLYSEECQMYVKNSECYSGICKCKVPFKTIGVENKLKCVHETVVKGSFCDDDFDCRKDYTNMKCISNKCDCDNHNYIFLKSFPGHSGKCYKQVSRGNRCQRNEQCQATDRNMICRYVCVCDINYIYLQPNEWKNGKCYKKASTMYDTCELDDQCFDVSNKAVCSKNNNLCVCRLGYYYIGNECIRQEEFERSKAQQVYRTAMIAAACFMIGIVSIFVMCIVKKSFCDNNNTSTLPGGQQRTNSQLQRMTSLTDDDVIVADKPPSYEEVILAEIPTTPPPKYTDISKLFPITEGLQRHSSEPHLPCLGSSHNRSNSFHAYDNLTASNNVNDSEVTAVSPPSYEEEYLRPKPKLHLNIPLITVIAPNDENETQNHSGTNSESTD